MSKNSLIDFDHISFAVDQLMPVAQQLREQLGVTPIFGEALPEFRYVLLHLGDTQKYTRIELMEPAGEGFLQKYVDKFGIGAHHITFAVPDVVEVAQKVEAAGFRVVGENTDNPAWMEAFIAPDGVHRFVIQIASSQRAYPSPQQILAGKERDLENMPAVQDGLDSSWWEELWNTAEGPRVQPGPAVLRSTDLTASKTLFAGVLGGSITEESADTIEFSWAGGVVRVLSSDQPGAVGLSVPGMETAMEFGPARVGEI